MKKIVRFYKKNKEISNWGIVSFLISFSYAITYNMPDYLGIEPYYSLANNICISYIAALLFYVVQVYLPGEKEQQKCMEILKSKFDDIVRFNEIAVLVFEKHIEIGEKGAVISWNGEGEKIYLKIKSSDETKGAELNVYTKSQLLKWKKEFDEKMEIIKDSALIYYCDYEILSKLSELEKYDFFSTIQRIIIFASSDINIKSFNVGIKEFKRANEELKKLCNISENYYLADISDEEKLHIDSIKNCLERNELSLYAFNREIWKGNIEKQMKEQGIEFSSEVVEAMCDKAMAIQNFGNGI